MKIEIIVPAYEELENLEILLPQWSELSSSLKDQVQLRWLIILEPDPAWERYQSVKPEALDIQFIAREDGVTYGSALRTGIQSVSDTADAVLFMDADGSHDANEINGMLGALKAGNDIVIASRYVRDGATDNPVVLIWLSRILNVLFRLSIGSNVRDISNSFKLYRRELLRGLQVTSENFEAVEEIFVFASSRATSIIELPTHFSSRLRGTSKRRWANFVLTYFMFLRRHRRSS